MDSEPLVSVVMPLYNSEKYVEEAITSIINQTYGNWELIIINDGSRDNCGKIAQSFADDRIRYIERENKGFIYSLNEGISLAKGKYVARLDDDDVAYNERFAKQVEIMEHNENVVLCGSSYDWIINGKKRTIHSFPNMRKHIKLMLLYGINCMAHSSFMIRKESLETHRIEYELFKQVPDFHMETQLAEIGDIYYIEEPLVIYRVHAQQSTAVRSATMKQGEFDQAMLWYINKRHFEPHHKEYICKAVLRELSSTEDVMLFTDAYIASLRNMGVDVDDAKYRDCITYTYTYILNMQYHTLSYFISVLKGGDRRLLIRGKNTFNFLMKCLLHYNKHYIKTVYDYTDDGMIAKH